MVLPVSGKDVNDKAQKSPFTHHRLLCLFLKWMNVKNIKINEADDCGIFCMSSSSN